CMQVLDFPLTF
nr:immunoglobulin light chain junction region [Macaca mulatta]MOX09147.1 immunoglobulin light chain junction region [Macaca mulatta]